MLDAARPCLFASFVGIIYSEIPPPPFTPYSILGDFDYFIFEDPSFIDYFFEFKLDSEPVCRLF